MSELAEVERDLNDAFTIAEEIRGRLQAGEMPDASALGALVQTVCLETIKLPNDDATKVRLRLNELLELLQALKADLLALQAVVDADPAQPAGG